MFIFVKFYLNFYIIYKILTFLSIIKIHLFSRLISKPNFWKWLLHIQKVDEESIIRPEQEHQQQRTTRRRKKQNILRDLCLNQLKKEYEKNLIDINEYQRRIRHISYLYIDTLDNTVDSDDSE